jgi:archaeal flagellin FlaB
MKRLRRSQAGMTGLETAIILIAFSTVAAVFGYAILNAGLYSAERGKETVYAGLSSAKSNLELAGSVTIKTSSGAATEICFTVRNAIAGTPIDMTPCDGTGSATNETSISLVAPSDYFSNIKWDVNKLGANDGDNLLESGEQFEVVLILTDLGAGKTLGRNITANDSFSIQVKPAMGSTITIMRALPSGLDPVMDLH